MDLQIPEAHQTPHQSNSRETPPVTPYSHQSQVNEREDPKNSQRNHTKGMVMVSDFS
jgi:5-methylcytosine-specific restriction endonuclease McrA